MSAGPREPREDGDIVERAQYAIEFGNSDRLHRDLLAEVERLRKSSHTPPGTKLYRDTRCDPPGYPD